jgi:hypothetical protein
VNTTAGTILGDKLLEKMSKDIRAAAAGFTRNEARYLVELHYDLQAYRIESQGRMRSLAAAESPVATFEFFLRQIELIEEASAKVLDTYSAADALGRWARSIHGVGPKLAAGLLAHVDIANTKTAGQLWAFAGLDPSRSWDKGQKRPWNARLKKLCWLIGESFVKVSGNEDAFYGRIYRERKELETAKNAAGEYAEQAARALKVKRYGAETGAKAAYEQGMLPKAHIHARAKRYAVKLFLAHYFEVGCKLSGRVAPVPYPVAHLQHAHYIAPPGIGEVETAA